MATDTTPAPTDAELMAVIKEASRGGAIRREGSTSLRIARAVLAKWGAQPAASPAPVVAREPLTVDDLAQEIRRVDGAHSLGAGALAEALILWLQARGITSKEGDTKC
ncbi:hypothetical protein [Acidovorax sp. LjRoot117]|uniref:hypothetical protein n=1 Tax=Acidovorax sp. LjRoot117 TaxID=3342255 RepID=UPI003ECC4FFF